MRNLIQRMLGRKVGADEAAPLRPEDFLARAREAGVKGATDDAVAFCETGLRLAPGNFDLLSYFGALRYQLGMADHAADLFRQAVIAEPGNAAARTNLGLALQAAGMPAEAEAALRGAVATDPDSVAAHNALGALLASAGRVEPAAASFAAALRVDPGCVQALNNLGILDQGAGRLDNAEALFRQALTISPEVADIWINLGGVLVRLGRHADAAICFREALALQPRPNALAQNGLGRALAALGKWSEARECFGTAFADAPGMIEAHCNLAEAHLQLGDLTQARACCEAILKLRPHYAEARNVLASVMASGGDWEGAISLCRETLEFDPLHPATLSRLGAIQQLAGRLRDAEDTFRAASAAYPDSAQARYNLGINACFRGDWMEGFLLYESRFACFPGGYDDVRHILEDHRRWRGGELVGRRVLVWTEQGFGDVLMMLRFLPDLKDRGASEVIVLCAPELRRTVESVSGVDRVVDRLSLVDREQYDLHCPILSLPLAEKFSPDMASGRIPYIGVPDAMRHAWDVRLGSHDRLRVGLCWGGRPGLADDARRSMRLDVLSLLRDIPEVQWFSLQKGERAAEAAAWGAAMIDLMSACDDFHDTAALISALDLVITVDSAVAHLAGALGRDVWMLDRFGSEWRWGQSGSTTFWYPSMKIFRQASPGDWAPTIAQVSSALGLRHRRDIPAPPGR